MHREIVHSASRAKSCERFGAIVLLALFIFSMSSWSQETLQTVQIDVHANRSDGPLAPIWTYFGYDEPNYSYALNGRKLLAELSALSPLRFTCECTIF